jgi:hypothetical protein
MTAAERPMVLAHGLRRGRLEVGLLRLAMPLELALGPRRTQAVVIVGEEVARRHQLGEHQPLVLAELAIGATHLERVVTPLHQEDLSVLQLPALLMLRLQEGLSPRQLPVR